MQLRGSKPGFMLTCFKKKLSRVLVLSSLEILRERAAYWILQWGQNATIRKSSDCRGRNQESMSVPLNCSYESYLSPCNVLATIHDCSVSLHSNKAITFIITTYKIDFFSFEKRSTFLFSI